MPPRLKPTGTSSPGSSPQIVFDVEASRGTRAAVLGFALLAAAALSLAPAPGPLWRALGAVLSLGLGAPLVRALIFNRGPKAVRRVLWRPDGSWRIETGGRQFDVQLTPATATLGGFILLAWRNPVLGRRYALVEASCIGHTTFRVLEGRLRTEKG